MNHTKRSLPVIAAALLVLASSCKDCEKQPGPVVPDAPVPTMSGFVPPTPVPTPIDREIAEKTKKAELSVAAKEACARQPDASIDSIAVCIAEGGPKEPAQQEGGTVSTDAGAPSAQFKKALEAAGAQFASAMSAAGEDGGQAAREAYDETLKKAVHDELVRRAAEVAEQNDGGPGSSGGSSGGGSPGGGSPGGGGDVGKLLTLLLAAGCMAYTGAVAACAVAAQFLGGILGGMGKGDSVDVERARRISEATTQLQKGTCDNECLARLYEDTGAKGAVERGVQKELGRFPKATQERVKEGFRVFQCVATIDVTGTKAAAAVQKCGIGGPAVQDAARVISNCVEHNTDANARRKACVEEAARCIVVENDKAVWRCAK